MNTYTSSNPIGSYRVGWFISGNEDIASSRLQGFRIHEHFLSHGIHSEIIAANFNHSHKRYSAALFSLARQAIHNNLDVVFFSRPNWMMYKISLWSRLNGIRTIAIRCDNLHGEYDRYFDATIVPTMMLKEKLGIDRAHIIEDMIEVPQISFKGSYEKHEPGPLRVVWVGHGSYKSFISKFIESISAMDGLAERFEFITISKGDWATHAWSLETVYSHILNCDIAIIPMPEGDKHMAKSANRLSMLMALGMPVIASPIPAYQAIAEDGANCILAPSMEDFRDALFELADATTRKNIGQEAREYAWRNFSPESIGMKWIEAMKMVMKDQVPVGSVGMTDRILARVLRL